MSQRPRRTALFLAPLLLAATAGACRAADSPAVQVNDVAIPQTRLDAAVAAARAAGAKDTPQLRESLKLGLAGWELFRQAAQRQGLDHDPAVLAARDEAMVRLYLRRNLRPRPVADADVRKRYDALVAAMGEREYRLRLMVLPDRDSAAALLQSIRQGDTDFAAAAAQRSGISRAGDDIGWVSFRHPDDAPRAAGLPAEIARALAGVEKPGLLPDPVALRQGFALVRVDAVRPSVVPGYEQARPDLRRMLEAAELARATQALAARLVDDARIALPAAPEAGR